MTIEIDVVHRLGKFALEARFESDGRLIALFGHSGSGKTSLINLIGGLTRPDTGRIAVNGRVLVDVEAGVFVPAHKRRIGYVFQDARLFPHMTVAQNLNYGRFFTPAGERYADFGAVVELLGIGHLLDRRPGRLSGGEKQRVAIGRALVASPRLILMDEPLASLDEARKAEIMPYIETLRDEADIPIVYVSHSIAEVARLATDIVALAEGKVAASGPAARVLPLLNLPGGKEQDGESALIELVMVEPDEGYGLSLMRSAGGGEWRLPKADAPAGARLRVRVRARDVMLARERPHDISALNVLKARIASIASDDGPQALVRLDHGGEELVARITRRSLDTLGLAPGAEVFAIVKTATFDPAATAAAPARR
ncbi:MAG: molybdenum ABC transporter ATP-binding protein [Aquamicrobium sp.]|uniref:molybdenum ABC transporter ATP-binding protein n=1 Tax=Aquamicrobium sp. TaxID=1872579 RepID=UPI00349ED951|nr:molybdenum ABC transporter ATP-binding protein [Aquamicrobium sp.]